MSKTERISFIHSSIKRYGRITVKDVVKEFEVTDRTVRRDFEELRLMHNAPLIYDRQKQIYYYEDEFEKLDFFNDKVFLYYTLINSITSSSAYIPVVAEEFKEFIEDKLSDKYIKIANKMSFQLSEFENVKIEYFYKIFQSMIESKSLIINYTNIKENQTTREITPQKLINYSGSWYLFAYDLKKSSLRNFNLSRISTINFGEKIQNFELEKSIIDLQINDTFGIYKGLNKEKVSIKFYNEAATIVKNQTWQNGQTSEFDNTNRILTLTINVVSKEEIIGKVLKYGSNAEIISPINIREAWLNEIMKMRDIYL